MLRNTWQNYRLQLPVQKRRAKEEKYVRAEYEKMVISETHKSDKNTPFSRLLTETLIIIIIINLKMSS
jgi:hypothetical protein